MLDPSVKQKIIALHAEMSGEGKLLSRQKLENYCAVFRNHFGPSRLESLDGEALLTMMHDHGNRDSLVYWIDYKNDDEFPAHFGSIAGGAAVRHGVRPRFDA